MAQKEFHDYLFLTMKVQNKIRPNDYVMKEVRVIKSLGPQRARPYSQSRVYELKFFNRGGRVDGHRPSTNISGR